MAAPNIVNVATITGVTTWKAGISTLPGTPSVIASNAASSGKVIKINSIVAVALFDNVLFALSQAVLSLLIDFGLSEISALCFNLNSLLK